MMKNIPFVDIDYCQFSDWGCQKPTRFWGSPNLGNLAHVRCPGKACLNVIKQGQRLRHKENLGGNGMRFNTILKGRIPPKVVDYLIQDGEYALINQRKSGIYARKRGYKVDPKIRAEIFQKMGVDRALICVDLFADQENALDQMYMTEQNSAWSYDWSKFCDDGKILWANPPIEDLKRVVTKACLEPCKLLLVSPNWKFGNWKEILGKVAVKEYVAPPISHFFRKKNGGLLSTGRLGIKFSMVDTINRWVSKEDLDPLLVQEVENDKMGLGPKDLAQAMENYPTSYRGEWDDGLKRVVVDRVRTEKDLRLLMDIYARLPSGKGQVLKVLIDTGAEANLIREGLVSSQEFCKAEECLNLTTANGQTLRGGQRELHTHLLFRKRLRPGGKVGNYAVDASFHEAEINVDVILGYPWLKSKKIGVFPCFDALAIIRGKDRLDWLRSTVESGDGVENPKFSRRVARTIEKLARLEWSLDGHEDIRGCLSN